MKRITDTVFIACIALFIAGNSLLAQNVGIGTLTPQTKLHVANGVSGATPFVFSPLVVESNGHTYINLLSPAINETAILFGLPANSASGVIMYNNSSTLNGFQFRNNGNITRMVINSNGNVGINTLAPSEKLEVAGDIRAVNMKAASYQYTSPKTVHYTMSGIDFIPTSSSDTALIAPGSGDINLASLVPGKLLIAPLHLPDGAALLNMKAYMTDNNPGANLQVTLYRKMITDNFSADNLATVITTGSGGATTAYPATIPGGIVIDNSQYTYYVIATTSSSLQNWFYSMFLRALIIDYTSSSIL